MSIDALNPQPVGPGVYLLKMPLPFRLNHINLYLLEAAEGWYLIDTGLNTPLSQQLWQAFLTSGFFKKPILKIILTHLHPDHIGMSAWLSDYLKVEVQLSAGDLAFSHFLWQNDSDEAKDLYTRHWTQFGLEGTELDEMVALRTQYRTLVKQLPRNISVIAPHARLNTLSGEWIFLPGAGHAPEHMCLWNAETQMLISGDHILPGITPNISLHPFGLKNPLGDYLSSLRYFETLPCQTYCPAHGAVSTQYVERIQALMQHHHTKLKQILAQLPNQATRVNQALPYLFNTPLPAHQLMFAYSETAAHLVYLVAQNQLEQVERQGVFEFYNPNFNGLDVFHKASFSLTH